MISHFFAFVGMIMMTNVEVNQDRQSKDYTSPPVFLSVWLLAGAICHLRLPGRVWKAEVVEAPHADVCLKVISWQKSKAS